MSTDKSARQQIHSSIARSASAIGLATLLSRLLGLVRDVVIARVFGIFVYAQAFVIAFRIPNLFRDLLAEGAANAAFVPVLSEYSLTHSKKEFWELVNVVFALLLIILSSIVLLGIFFSPVLVRLIAPGFITSPEKLAVTITLNRIVFPYLLLIGLSAYFMAILNSLKHFIVPALAPCMLNIALIICALLFGERLKGLALGVLAGGVLQLAIQIPVLYRKGFRLQPWKRLTHPAAKLIGKLMAPRLISSAIYQLNNFVDSIFGSLAWIVGDGGVAVLYYATRLFQLPLGIFSNALSQALLPTLSTQGLEDNLNALKQTFSWGLRTTFFVMLPASVAFIVLSFPVVNTLFGGGKFDLHSAQMTAQALMFYSIGLSAYGGNRIVQSCFFALKDTTTPTKISGLALLINIVLNFVFMFPLRIGGIALATSISGIISFCVLLILLKKKLGDFSLQEVLSSCMRILLASLSMGLVSYLVYHRLISMGSGTGPKIFSLGVTIITGICAYIGFCFLFRVKEAKQLWAWVKSHKLAPLRGNLQ